MNKQEVIEKIEKEKSPFNSWEDLNRNNALDDALDIVEKLDEPEKPVVPQFIANWLEVCKENLGFGLLNAMIHSTSAMNKQPNWVKRWFNFKDNQETFAKAWLFGYEVEKEKLYTVKIPSSNDTNHFVLCKRVDGKVCIGCYISDTWQDYKCVQLTEAEIKEDFEWAWQFAKEVKK